MITLSSIGIDCGVRVYNTNGTTEINAQIDAASSQYSGITAAFCDAFFFNLVTGRKNGNTTGSYAAVLKCKKWESGAFQIGNKVILPAVGNVNRYENESNTIYEIAMEKIYDGANGNAYAGSSQTGFYTDLEVYFIPEGVLAINAETQGTLIFTSTSLQKSTLSTTIESGQSLKGISVPYGNGSSSIAGFYTTFKFVF